MTKLYNKYWGKAENDALKVAYCSGSKSKEEIFEQFKPQLAKSLNKPENQLQPSDLDEWAKKADKKTGKQNWEYKQADYAAYHLLPYHCLDVAAVGKVLLDKNVYLTQCLSRLTGINEEILKPVLLFFLVLHDLGKFSESFQNIKPELLKELQSIKKSLKHPYSKKDFGHDSMGFLLWKNVVSKQVFSRYEINAFESNDWLDIINCFMQAANGHHGMPVKQGEKRFLDNYFSDMNKDAVIEFVEEVINLFSLETFFKTTDLNCDFHDLYKNSTTSSWLFAGFCVLCDWIGSGKKFIYKKNEMALKQYWEEIALKTAEQAIDEASVLPCRSNRQLNPLKELLDLPKNAQLSPLQQIVASIELSDSPQLFIIEDATGAGKTEASLILLNRLMAKGLAYGFYLALPTMATADGIYPRVQKTYDKLFASGEKPSLILSHSSAKLSQYFTDTIISSDSLDSEQAYPDDAQSRCQAWLADNRKKSLLAHVGVGTIDQTFLAVLKAKYQSLRLIGLVGKVLVIDEAHAYDAYMGEELKVLLEVHAALGGSVIIMSATLPFVIRQSLSDAFLKGLRVAEQKLEEKNKYPLLTHIAKNYKQEIPFIAKEKPTDKIVHVNFLHTRDSLHNIIKQAISDNKCVCWIKNSVRDAREEYVYFKTENFNVGLFHARFTLADRLKIQDNVLSSFNKDSKSEQRNGKLLIATQVVEQSLDLDFDVIITDLAPIDLVLQRAGRLHRHIRDKQGNLKLDGDDERGTPKLYVYTPEFIETPAANWFAGFFPNAKKVYENHAIVWLSLKLLNDLPAHQLPANIRDLIEGVYGESVVIPKNLENTDIRAVGNKNAEKANAKFNLIRYENGYEMNEQSWLEELNAPTRLGEDTITLTLCKWEHDRLTPFNKEKTHSWQKSEIRVFKKNISAETELTKAQQAAFEHISDQLPSKGKWLKLVVMNWIESKQLWQGNIKDGRGQDACFYYHPEQGLIYAYELVQIQNDDQLETEEVI
jgi:CRISPR-associated endonuclease/helicase Cas3